VAVGVRVGVLEGVAVGVFVGVFDGVFVGVRVGVGLCVPVGVMVGVQAAMMTDADALPKTGNCPPWSMPEASISSLRKAVDPEQGGAVSSTLPLQVSAPFAAPKVPRTGTAVLPCMHGTATGVPPGKGTVFVTWRLVT